MALPTAPDPVSPLARYRILSPTANLRVSPLCLGAMNFGTAWEQFMGKCDKETTFGILDYFFGELTSMVTWLVVWLIGVL